MLKGCPRQLCGPGESAPASSRGVILHPCGQRVATDDRHPGCGQSRGPVGASSHVLCDRLACPSGAEPAPNRSQLMRMPQVAESYLNTDTIDLLRKEIGLQTPAAATPAMFDHIFDPHIREVIRLPVAGWKLFCYPASRRRLHRSATVWTCRLPLKLAAAASARWAALTGIETPRRPHRRVFIDHGMGVVTETSEIGPRCLLYQGVTLGGTGKNTANATPLAENVVVGGRRCWERSGSVQTHESAPDLWWCAMWKATARWWESLDGSSTRAVYGSTRWPTPPCPTPRQA